MNIRTQALMTALLFLLLISAMAFAPTCRAGDDFTLENVPTIAVDGKAADWPSTAITFIKEPMAAVGLARDSARIYIMIRFNNQEWERTVRMGGLTIWLDAGGKKDKKFKIKFIGGPAKEQMAALPAAKQPTDNRMPADMRQRMEQRENQFLIYQEGLFVETPLAVDGSEGPQAACGVENGFFVYEFSMPFQKTGPRTYGLGSVPDKAIGVGLVWGDMDMGDRKGPDGGGPGSPGGGMPPGGGPGGGMPPGGGPGGGGSGGRPGMPSMPEKQEIWLKAKIIETPPANGDATGR